MTASADTIVSYAHDVRQDLPLSAKRYVCMRCGLTGDLATLFGERRCERHLEFATSGWLDESWRDARGAE